jgi:hypothetical protein
MFGVITHVCYIKSMCFDGCRAQFICPYVKWCGTGLSVHINAYRGDKMQQHDQWPHCRVECDKYPKLF